MFTTGPINQGKSSARASIWLGLGLVLALGLAPRTFAQEGRQLESIEVQPTQGQGLQLRLRMNAAAPEPMSFTMESDPARIVIDLPDTALALDERRQDVNSGAVASFQAAESNGRTRIVLNMNRMVPYTTRVEGDSVFIDVGGAAGSAQPTFAAQPAAAAPAARVAPGVRAIQNIDFRRGPDGAGQVIVDLTDPRTTVDVREEGGRVIVEFADTNLPTELMRRLDVSDFATPVVTVDALRDAGNARLVVTPNSQEPFTQVAYQADNRFTLELGTPVETAQQTINIFSADREYVGERLTLTFQNLETRAVLSVLAEFSGLNIVVSDTVQGNVTLRLQDVPWDQAFDVVMTTKGLDMRQNGNVIIVAPAEEIAAREQAALQAAQSRQQLEPLYTELIQVNYAKATDLATLIRGGADGASLLSVRGGISVDPGTNQLLVQETAETLREIRRWVQNLDIPPRQVLIESRIVIVNDDFSKELGVRLGTTAARENSSNGMISMTGTSSGSDTIVESALDNLANTGSAFPVTIGSALQRYAVNLPVVGPAGVLNFAILDNDYLVDLELSAVQAEGKGEIVSTPRIITANNMQARIEEGVEIPYQEASSSGATTTQFQEAVLSLTVTPQITPDNRVIMDLLVTKDSVGELVSSATGGFVPSIDTRSVQNRVLVNDGQTVVLGGIYETETRDTVSKVPVLGDIPGLGFLFRKRTQVNNKSELLIFVTPRIIREGATIE
ncbi:MAG TPA: type IV pilus secretin PilQ [Gammaproteobacteria bacterium]|nr:type IV pilus secretin PilQ [Gammaproteobacteria bacterium]